MRASMGARISTIAALIALALAGCSRPLARARTERFEPTLPAERAAAQRLAEPRCDTRLGGLAPGVGQICNGQEEEGAVLAAVGASELATGITVAAEKGIDHPGAAVPLLAYSDLWVYSSVALRFDRDRAAERMYVPADSTADLAVAPFNIQVLKRPDVFLGIVGMLAAGIGVSLAVDESIDSSSWRNAAGGDPNLFGKTIDRRIGYPIGLGIGAGLFIQVAMAEESVFRGWAQSGLARAHGETWGWVEATALFGAAHLFNVVSLPSDQRLRYVTVGVPFITALGGYMGWVYRRSGYSLATSVALHFWYDFALSATFFVLDPQHSPLSAGLRWSF